MDNNRCVICGEIIPEGRMVCGICEYKINNSTNTSHEDTTDTENKRASTESETIVNKDKE